MKVFVVLMSAVLGYAQGAVLGAPMGMMRMPQFDSAVISMERLGGNFAYETKEAHAYAVTQPLIQNVPTPIGASYVERPIFGQVTYHEPASAAVIAPAPVAPAYYPAAPAPIAADYPMPAAPIAADYPMPAAPVMGAPAMPAAPIMGAPAMPAAPIMDAPAMPAAPIMGAPGMPAAPIMDAPSMPTAPIMGGAPSMPQAPIAASGDPSDDTVTIESAL